MSHPGWILRPLFPFGYSPATRKARPRRERRLRSSAGNVRLFDCLEERTLLSTVAVDPIKDVKTIDEYPAQLTPAGTNLFYVVEDATDSGQDLVATTAGGTQVLRDFPTAATAGSSGPSQLTAIGNDVFFTTSAGGSSAYDNELWRSDGTPGGTTQLSIPGTTVETYESLTDLNGNLVVLVDTGSGETNDNQMWEIPGGTGTPTLVEDFSTNYAAPDVAVGSTLYLSVDGNLWATGGTAASTRQVGGSVATPEQLIDFQGSAYYFNSSSGQTTFGTVTPSGETQIGTIAVSSVANPLASSSSLYFAASATSGDKATQLWVTSGTQAGTRMIEDFSSISPLSVPSNLTFSNGTLYFTLEGANGQEELWESSGTAAGTTLLLDLGTGAGYGGYYGYLTALEAVGGTVYFAANTSATGAELWSTNGTTQGTQMVDDINPGVAGSDPQRFVTFDDQLYFVAHNGTTPQQNQLWKTTGTAAGTQLVASFSPGVTEGSVDLYAGSPDTATLAGELLLPLEDGVDGTELWATNGTAAGTVLLAAVNPKAIAVVGSEAYFLGSRTNGTLGLWETNGTAAGTSEVRDLSSYESGSSYFAGQSMVASGNTLYFTTNDGSGGVDLWMSNGTAAGTSVVKDFTASSGSFVAISDLMPFDGGLVFVADDGTAGTELWVSNGTGSGTQMVTGGSQSADHALTPSDVTVVGNSLYFFAPDSSQSIEGLWLMNSLSAAPTEVAAIPDITPAGQTTAAAPTPAGIASVGSRIFFYVQYYYDSSSQYQLWTSNGTPAGTTALSVLPGGALFSNLGAFESLGGDMIFQAVQSSGGPLELWKSDGTTSGTVQITDIASTSSASTFPYYSDGLAVGGTLYFAADDSVHGNEVWQTDGTAAGTSMAADINPGAGSSNPMLLGVVGGQLVLAANDGVHGIQLMEAVIDPPVVTPVATPPVLAAIPAQIASDGGTLQVNLASYASDTSAAPASLTYSLAAGAPSGVSVDPSSGVLTWSVPADQPIGSYPVTVVVSASTAPTMTASTTFDLNVTDPGPAPAITAATVTDKHGLTITLSFSQPLDPATAEDTANYILDIPAKPAKKHRKGPAPQPTPVPLSVSFNPSTDQVTLKVIGKVSLARPLDFTVVGTGPGGIAKVTGLLLAGSGGQSGTNYTATVTSKKIKSVAAVASNELVVRPAIAGKIHPEIVKKNRVTRAVVAHRTPGGPLARKPARSDARIVLGIVRAEEAGRQRHD